MKEADASMFGLLLVIAATFCAGLYSSAFFPPTNALQAGIDTPLMVTLDPAAR